MHTTTYRFDRSTEVPLTFHMSHALKTTPTELTEATGPALSLRFTEGSQAQATAGPTQ